MEYNRPAWRVFKPNQFFVSTQTAKYCSLGDKIAASTCDLAFAILDISSPILVQSSGLSPFLRKFNKLTSGSRRHAPFVVMNSKCAFIRVSSHVRRSSGWILLPLHMHIFASVGREYFPAAEPTLSCCNARAPEMLLETKNSLRARLPLTADLSSNDG